MAYDFSEKVALGDRRLPGHRPARGPGARRRRGHGDLGYAGNEAAAAESAAAVEAAGGKAIPRRFDVADPEACKAAIEDTVEGPRGSPRPGEQRRHQP